MKKHLVAIITVLFVLSCSIPQKVFAISASSFVNNDAVCAQLPKISAALNLLDISKKIVLNHFNMAFDSFSSCFIVDICSKDMEISTVFESAKVYIFANSLKTFKSQAGSIKFLNKKDDSVLILYDDDILINQILLRLKTVVKAVAPSESINIIMLNKFI